jgi:hypothetical protein
MWLGYIDRLQERCLSRIEEQIERRSKVLEAFTANVANKKQKTTEHLLLGAPCIRNPIMFHRIFIKSDTEKIQNNSFKEALLNKHFFKMAAAGCR